MNKMRILAIVMTAVMVLGITPTAGFAVTDTPVMGFADMPDNWSTSALERAVQNGLLNGYTENGKLLIKADAPLKRAELAAVVNRAFGAAKVAALKEVTDVSANSWYYSDIGKAVQMGTFILDKTMRPEDNITRQEAFTVLARAFKLVTEGKGNGLEGFKDKDDVATWAKDSLSGMVSAGYIKGSDGLLNPKANITRAEFATVMDNLIKQYIDATGTVTDVIEEGNVLVRKAGATLKDLTIKGDLIIADGVGEGDVTLENVTVEGRTLIRGGGENSIIIKGDSQLGLIILSKVDGKVRVVVEGGAVVDIVYVDDGSDDVIVEGTIGSLEIAGDNITAYAVNAVITNANVSGENSKIVTEENTVVEEEEKKPSQGGGGGPSTPAVVVSAISVTTQPIKTEYEIGEAIDLAGLVVTATYSDSSTKSISVKPAMISGFDSSAAKANQVVTVTYEGKTATFNVTIKEVVTPPATLESIAITTSASKLVYTVGDELDITGLIVTGTYSDASTKKEAITVANISGFDSTSAVASQTLTITVDGKTATYTIEVKEAVPVDKYVVTFSVVDNKGGTLSAKANDVDINSGDQVDKGSDLVFTAAPDTGYEIKQWKYNGTVYEGTEEDFEHTNLWQDFNVTVEFEAIAETFTVTFMSDGANGDMDPVKVIEGQKYKLPENGFTALQHKKFDYWRVEDSDDKYYPGNKVEITGDTTFWATWVKMPIEILDAPAKVLPGQTYMISIYIDGEYQDGTKISEKVNFSIDGGETTSSGTNITTDGYLNVAIDETAEQFTLRAAKKNDADVYDEVTIKVHHGNALIIKMDDPTTDGEKETVLGNQGYYWNKDNLTLEIRDLEIVEIGQGIVFEGFYSNEITLVLHGSNKINIEAGELEQVTGIRHTGNFIDLTIKGTGSLEITMPDLGDKDTSSYGIRMYSLTVEDSASLIITNVKAKDSRGIYTSDYTIFRGNAKVEVESYGWVIDARGTSPGISIEGKAEFKGIAQGVGSILYTTGEINIEKGTKVELVRPNFPHVYGGPKFFGYRSALNIAPELKLQASENADGSNLETAELTDDNPEKVVRDKDADPVEDVFKYVLIKAGEVEKTVTVGDMEGDPIYAGGGSAASRSYIVTTTGIENGEYATVNWYTDASKSENTSEPAGISIASVNNAPVDNSKITLRVTVNNSDITVADDYYFTVTIDGIESDVKTFTIETATLVEIVTISGLSVPVVGADPYDKTGLSVPENAGYVIEKVDWFDHTKADGGESGWGVVKFEQGHKYQININLKLEPGYQFASNRDYVLDELAVNLYEKVQWGSAAAYDAQLLVIFNELE